MSMDHKELEGRVAESEKCVQSVREKISEIEKSVADMNRNIERLFGSMEEQRLATKNNQRTCERLFGSMEEQRLATENNQRALANLISGMNKGSIRGEEGASQKRKTPETESESTSKIKSGFMENEGDHEAMIRHRFKKVDIPIFDEDQPNDWLFRAE